MHTERSISVVIPAHNEGESILALLEGLDVGRAGDVDLIVVCNGCTDDTASRARAFSSAVRVLEVPEASKRQALIVGDAASRFAYRAWVDADVVITRVSLELLRDALHDGVLVAAPNRCIVLRHSSWPVRWYYEIWQSLPHVRSSVFGRGVLVMSPEGHARASAVPQVMSDDLAVAEAFNSSEVSVVTAARVEIFAPGNLRDLLRRRVRVVTGNLQLDAMGLRRKSSRTRFSQLFKIAVSHPSRPLKVIVFLGVTALARVVGSRNARAGDFSTWLRDESSRQR